MTVQQIDRNGTAMLRAAEGQEALGLGDTLRAGNAFREAAVALEQEAAIAHKRSDKTLRWFLAASHYYYGGHYRDALRLCGKIDQKLLPRELRTSYTRFLQDVRERSKSTYVNSIQRRLIALWRANNHAGIIEVLQHHPYVMPREAMAFVRATACEDLGKYREAALFYADAIRWGRDPTDVIYCACASPLTRLGEERAEESWEYLSYQMELFPHAIVFMTAALVRFAQAAQTDDPKAKLDLWGNVVELCEKAWDQFNQLPAADIRNPAVRQLMTISLEAAALVSTQVGQHEEAKRLVDEAVRLSSTSYSAWGLRGIVYQPDPRCEEFFRKAMELGDPTYMSAYYLAQVAMMRKGFDEALRWCDLALEKVPHPSIRAELFGWKAVARHCQGASESEVRALFGQGLAIQPENPNLRHNYSIFQKEIADRQPMAAVRVGQVGTVRFNDYLTWDESRTTTQRFVAEDIVRKTHNLPTQGFVANRRKRLEDQMSHAVGVSN